MNCRVNCRSVIALLLASATPARADGLLPPPLAALAGCWSGIGVLSDKPVTVRLTAAPVIADTVVAVDLVTSGEADPLDHYSAHILLGGDATAAARIVSLWSDSFGMAFAANGDGTTRGEGFDVTWFYPDDNVLGRWRRFGDQLAVSLVRIPRAPKLPAQPEEKPFADYALSRVDCASRSTPGPVPSPALSPLRPGQRQRVRSGG